MAANLIPCQYVTNAAHVSISGDLQHGHAAYEETNTTLVLTHSWLNTLVTLVSTVWVLWIDQMHQLVDCLCQLHWYSHRASSIPTDAGLCPSTAGMSRQPGWRTPVLACTLVTVRGWVAKNSSTVCGVCVCEERGIPIDTARIRKLVAAC